jgi:hypothetical protein
MRKLDQRSEPLRIDNQTCFPLYCAAKVLGRGMGHLLNAITACLIKKEPELACDRTDGRFHPFSAGQLPSILPP